MPNYLTAPPFNSMEMDMDAARTTYVWMHCYQSSSSLPSPDLLLFKRLCYQINHLKNFTHFSYIGKQMFCSVRYYGNLH